MEYKYDVFISYSRRDIDVADNICNALDKVGISYFIDRQSVSGGMEFPTVLAQAICDSSVFLFLASKSSYKSKFTINEITFAFNKKDRNQIIPYIIDGSTLPIDLEFVFAGINWRTIKEHPINTILVSDILSLLRRVHVIEKRHSIQENGKCGFINGKGEIVIPSQWTSVNEFHEGYAVVKDGNGNAGFIDLSGKLKIPMRYKNAGDFCCGLAPVQDVNEKWGFVDKLGILRIPCNYNNAYCFNDELAPIQDEHGKWGYINSFGELEIPCQYGWAFPFNEGLAPVAPKGEYEYGYINRNGKMIIPLMDKCMDAWCFNEGFARIELKPTGRGWWLIDKTGALSPINRIIRNDLNVEWALISNYSEGLAALYDRHESVNLYDRYDGFYFRGFIDTTGKLVLPNEPQKWERDCSLDSVFSINGPFEDGLAWVKTKSEGWKLIDKFGQYI